MSKDNPQNPYTRDETATRADMPLPVQRATVIDAQDNALHRATVQIYGTSTTENATVLAPMYGSVWVPDEGTDVLVLYGADDTPYIIGSWYAEDRVEGGYVDVPDYNAGDIVVGNENGYIAVRSDGTVETSDTFSTYTDKDSQDAVGSILSSEFTYDDVNKSINMDPHVTNADAHHARYSNEEVKDVVGALVAGGADISTTYDDTNGTLTIDTSALNEEEVEDAVSALLVGGTGVSLNYDDANDTLTINGFSGSHSDLTNVGPSDHHARYSDSEVLGVVGDASNDVNIGVQDTRNTNEAPTFFDREVSYDFKETSTIGVPASGTYCGLMTFAPWRGNSGDQSHQVAYTNDGLFRRSAFPDSSTWGSWTKVGDEDKIFLAEGSSTNINQTATVSWTNTTFNDSAYSWDGSSQLTIEKAGRYEIHAEAEFTSSGATRQNPNLFIHQNNNIVGVGGRSGYMRDREEHDHSSVHSHAVIDANSGDVIDVESRAEADASGSITPDRAMFYVKRVQQGDTDTPTLGYFDSNLTGTQTNAENGLYVNFADSVNENDGWTVDGSSQISPEESGKYKIEAKVNFHRTGSDARNIMYAELEINKNSLSERARGSGYIRNSGNGNEVDANFSTIVDLNAGDDIRIWANEERGGETGNDIERANINITKVK